MINNIMKLIDKIKEQREISDLTLRNYNGNLKKIYKMVTGEDKKDGLDIDDIDKLKDVNKILPLLKDKFKANTIKNYLVGVIVGLRVSDKDYAKEIDEYSWAVKKLSEDIGDKMDENKKTESQQENWLSHKEVLKILKELKQEVNNKKLMEQDKLIDKDLDLLQQFVVLSLYSGKYFPPLRNDFADMKVKYDSLYDPEKDKENYYIIKKPNPYFIINSYKTARKYGTQKLEIKQYELKKLLKKWINVNPTDYFLINVSNKTPMTANGISKYLQKIFMRKRNKTISSSLLRSIYITDKYENNNLTQKEKKGLAKEMMHSKNMSEQVYNKIE